MYLIALSNAPHWSQLMLSRQYWTNGQRYNFMVEDASRAGEVRARLLKCLTHVSLCSHQVPLMSACSIGCALLILNSLQKYNHQLPAIDFMWFSTGGPLALENLSTSQLRDLSMFTSRLAVAPLLPGFILRVLLRVSPVFWAPILSQGPPFMLSHPPVCTANSHNNYNTSRTNILS